MLRAKPRMFAVAITAPILAASCTGSPGARPAPSAARHVTPTPAGQPPEGIAGTTFMCPAGYGFVAYASGYYPPTYPSPPPPSARPARCYRSSAEAEAAGYTLAPTPQGDLRIGLVYLVPADETFLATCRAAGPHLGFPVPCPSLVPESTDSVGCDGNCAFDGAFIAEGGFSGPPGYIGANPGIGHLWIMAARTRLNPPFWFTCGRPPFGSVMIRPGVHGGWINCPQSSEGNHAGHVLLVWDG